MCLFAACALFGRLDSFTALYLTNQRNTSNPGAFREHRLAAYTQPETRGASQHPRELAEDGGLEKIGFGRGVSLVPGFMIGARAGVLPSDLELCTE